MFACLDHQRSPAVFACTWTGIGVHLACALLTTSCAFAHLSIIRQGPESAGGLETGDFHGRAVAAGDFNGDGYDDLATGAPSEGVTVGMSTITAAGTVIINYGSALGLTHTGAVFRTATSIGSTSLELARFGDALAAGDFNDDGIADLAIGAPQEDSGTTDDAGRVYILHGGGTGLGGTLVLALRESDANGTNEPFDNFGASLAVGDFNFDGRDDLAVGAPGEDDGAGAVFFFLASDLGTGLTTAGAGWFKQSNLGGSDAAGSSFGAALAAGDFYGSDHDDLAAGAPNRTLPGFAGAGVIYLVQGGAAGLSNVNARLYSANNQDIAQTFGHFGAALATGRFWPGAYRHLAVGEPGRTIDGFAGAGRVLLFIGTDDGLSFGGGARELSESMAGAAPAASEHFGDALAAGDRWHDGDADWGTDGYDELAVGAPSEVVNGAIGAGRVLVFNGRVGGPNAIASQYTQEDLGDVSEAQDVPGSALVFGVFDDSGLANLAIGAHAEDTSDDILYSAAGVDDEEFVNAGCVYIVAPWRQPAQPLSCRNSVVYDCEGDLVFSQRPFDRVRFASCNKVMTVLLACERIAAGDADPDDVYTVQSWIDTQVDGTQWDLNDDEEWRLIDLMHITLMYSGNDAAYAVADHLSGGANPWEGPDSDTCSEFVDTMNLRAAALGMDATHFANPAGRPWSDPYSTPADLHKLARAAMNNTLFADIANETSHAMGFTNSSGAEEDTVVTNSFYSGLVNVYPNAKGIKPGKNDPSQRCHLVAATSAISGTAIAGAFGWDIATVGSATRYQDDANLLDLAWARCNVPTIGIRNLPPPGPLFTLANVSTEQGKYRRAGGQGESNDDEDAEVVVVHQAGSGGVTLAMNVQRTSEKSLGSSEVATYGMSPMQGHLGFTISNGGETSASLLVATSLPPAQQPVTLGPGMSLSIPPFIGTATTFTLSIQNQSSGEHATLTVEEHGYPFSITSTGGGLGDVLWTSTLERGGSTAFEDGIVVTAQGLDPNPGGSVVILVQRPGLPTDANPLPTWGSVRLLQNQPNPFNPATTILYELPVRSSVRLAVFDARGRLVRLLEDGITRDPGTHRVEWDGQDAWGRQAGSGVYFCRLETAQLVAARRMVLVK